MSEQGWLSAVMVVLVMGLAGCGGLSKPYPEKSLYAISVGDPPRADAPAPAGRAVLRIEGVRVSRPFDSSSFVYRVGASQFTNDYYNGFISSPDRLLAAGLVRWVANSGVFGSVIEGGSEADYQLSLETSVMGLYGDYSRPGKPEAVVEVRFFLIDARGGGNRVAFQKTYRESEALAGTNGDQLVEGWEAAYGRVLTALIADLRQPTVAELAKIDASR